MYPESFSALVACRRPLLLQGPMGPFFSRLADYLVEQGLRVRKVQFNGGDEFFYRRGDALRYTHPVDEWVPWLRRLLLNERIDAIVLFGQARAMHRSAIHVARQMGVRVFVFEEGYIRPHYVTLEVGGVNGHTSLPREADFYRESPHPHLVRPRDTRQRFSRMAWYAAVYATATFVLRGRYPHHVYHRDLHPAREGLRWVRSGIRKLRYAWAERHVLSELTGPMLSKRWYLLALQVHNDAQLTEHSPYDDVQQVIAEVMTSFAAHAPAMTELVIKHHPMDRAYRDYGPHITELTQRLRLDRRVRYVHDLHLPMLLKHARGVVTVNSTTGLQAMYHGTPVCVLGECLYAMPGLVHTGGLATFWRDPEPVELGLYKRFRAHVVKRTQLNASFYGRLPALQGEVEGVDDLALDAGFSLLETQSPYSIDGVIRKNLTVAQPLPDDVTPPIAALRDMQGAEPFRPTDSAANTLSGPEALDGQGEAHLA
jgi:capsular polysaccharide export protein